MTLTTQRIDYISEYLVFALEWGGLYTYKEIVKELTDVGIDFYDAMEYLEYELRRDDILRWVDPNKDRCPPGWIEKMYPIGWEESDNDTFYQPVTEDEDGARWKTPEPDEVIVPVPKECLYQAEPERPYQRAKYSKKYTERETP